MSYRERNMRLRAENRRLRVERDALKMRMDQLLDDLRGLNERRLKESEAHRQYRLKVEQ